tara:strand:- start:17 stop:1828 length:1812 start_codon:yes stop_codon:yes gene_type:complete
MTNYLKDQYEIYVNQYNDESSISDVSYCPVDNMETYEKPITISGIINGNNYEVTKNYFIWQDISGYYNELYNFNTLNDFPTCTNGYTSCCKRELTLDPCNNYLDNCDRGKSTGFFYEDANKKYTICHPEEIQSKINMFDNITEKPAGLEKFFMVLLVTIVGIVFYTLVSLPYEFWLRYGNSIQYIYYKVKSTCTNMGSKKSDSNNKLTIIEYIFPDNLDNVPYETCKANGQSGGREKEGKINSNYIEYHENGSKCINVDFGDDPDDRNSKQFPYNLGEYANDKTKVKNRFIAMMLKGFSFYFLYTILFIRLVLNKSLSFFSKQYQRIFEKNSYISSALLLINFLITPFIIIGVIISVIFGILSIFPMYITIADFVKSINIFKEDIENSPSTRDYSNYYKIYDFNNIFYSLNPKNFDPDSDGFHKNNKFFAIILGIFTALLIGVISADKERPGESEYSGSTTQIITIISLIVFPIGFYAASKYISMPEGAVKILDLLKKIILNLCLTVPVFFTIIATFAFGMTGGILAGLYSVFSTLFNFYYVPFSNSMEFLDLMKSHSKLLTILLLISVITSSSVGGLGNEVTGVLGGLLGLYLLYELYKLSK